MGRNSHTHDNRSKRARALHQTRVALRTEPAPQFETGFGVYRRVASDKALQTRLKLIDSIGHLPGVSIAGTGDTLKPAVSLLNLGESQRFASIRFGDRDDITEKVHNLTLSLSRQPTFTAGPVEEFGSGDHARIPVGRATDYGGSVLAADRDRLIKLASELAGYEVELPTTLFPAIYAHVRSDAPMETRNKVLDEVDKATESTITLDRPYYFVPQE